MRNFIVSCVELIILLLLMIIPIPVICGYCLFCMIFNNKKSPLSIYQDYINAVIIFINAYYKAQG